MARVRKFPRQIAQERQRLTWIRFHLPKDQSWPRWNIDDTDHFGPLANAPGCLKVLLGRMVDEPEHAVLIILWQSNDDIINFEKSPNLQEMLHILDADKDSLITLYWSLGFNFENELRGRITLTKLCIPPTYKPQEQGTQDPIYKAFHYKPPKGYQDPRLETMTWPPDYTRLCFAWFDEEGSGCFVFLRWSLEGDRQQEERLTDVMRESMSEAVAKISPPVESWELERWEIDIVSSSVGE